MQSNLIGAVSDAPVLPGGSRLRVLVIEDRADGVEAVTRALSRGFPAVEVLAVGDLETFRIALEYGCWDAVVAGAENRRCDPLRILEVLEEDDLGVPCVLVTADPGSEAAGRLLAAGAAACVQAGESAPLAEALAGRLPLAARVGAAAAAEIAGPDPQTMRSVAQAVVDACTAALGTARAWAAHPAVGAGRMSGLRALEAACEFGAGALVDCEEFLRPGPSGGWRSGYR